MKRFILEKSDDEFYTSHSDLALIGLGVNRHINLNSKIKRAIPDAKDIANTVVISILYVTRPSVEGFGQLFRSSCTGRQDLLQPAENSN